MGPDEPPPPDTAFAAPRAAPPPGERPVTAQALTSGRKASGRMAGSFRYDHAFPFVSEQVNAPGVPPAPDHGNEHGQG